MKRALSGLVGAGLAIAACSSGGSGGGLGGGDFGSTWTEYCKDDAAREQTCGGVPDEAGCVQAQSCVEASFRTSAMAPVLSCLTDRECNTSDDPCFDEGGQAVPKTAAINSYFSTCTSYLAQCADSDDLCGNAFALLSDAMLNELAACMSKPCTDAALCLDAALDKVDCL